jgi:hypothetical protein
MAPSFVFWQLGSISSCNALGCGSLLHFLVVGPGTQLNFDGYSYSGDSGANDANQFVMIMAAIECCSSFPFFLRRQCSGDGYVATLSVVAIIIVALSLNHAYFGVSLFSGVLRCV